MKYIISLGMTWLSKLSTYIKMGGSQPRPLLQVAQMVDCLTFVIVSSVRNEKWGKFWKANYWKSQSVVM